ncbi:GrpB family protein [Candidatus Bathyarchaeota archaeon]|nr:MAG: GrpB family protein [Candidatus Bathyarchaeota archaeon]
MAERKRPSQPMTEEQLRLSVVGELKPHDAPITLVEYDPAWPKIFVREATRIKAALGERAIVVEHVGSTSVPGLIAKPIIDILLVVADSADEPSYVPALEAAGYVLRIREPDWHQHRLFKGPDTNINLHVFTQGSEEIQRTLLLRDWLRTNEADRELYARTKRSLARRKWKYVQNYADAKSEVVKAILESAETPGG